jgi:hypothetical protein
MHWSDAQDVVKIWGEHLEFQHARLHALFGSHIPRSLLPLPAEKIEAALNFVAKRYHDTGDYEASKFFQKAIGPLVFYADDDKALNWAVSRFGEPQIGHSIIARLKSIQDEARSGGAEEAIGGERGESGVRRRDEQMTSQKVRNQSSAPFPRWLGPLWLFLVFLVNYDWPSFLLYGGIPWLGAWVIWRLLARTRWLRELSTTTVDKMWNWAGKMIWVIVVIIAGGVYYVNHYMPHGPKHNVGDETYWEDVSGLNIPDWAKFLRTRGIVLFMSLAFVGILVSGRPKGGFKNETDDHSH